VKKSLDQLLPTAAQCDEEDESQFDLEKRILWGDPKGKGGDETFWLIAEIDEGRGEEAGDRFQVPEDRDHHHIGGNRADRKRGKKAEQRHWNRFSGDHDLRLMRRGEG